ncbi:hypothetical protein NUJ30_08300 [Burkholderia contaminans]|uniref:hypothetical protein n=1 Tax=Burkholderia TaxID=32008 RepID=UPI0010F8CDE2|nr:MULTISPECIES: hypothetical protein [Burkholderia]MBD1412884.1 hypothetical protein [Burkholderia contaminans]UXZ68666.1 hypothetical protein NUJ29_08305 [Burkholderia contaminans]UXZ76427.1 hypothetical protein NUJ30_08300 [Burkholderia contaminans]
MNAARQTAALLQKDIDRHVPRLHVHTPDLGDALKTLNHAGAWPDGVDVSAAQAVACWRLVQYVRELPGELAEQFKV